MQKVINIVLVLIAFFLCNSCRQSLKGKEYVEFVNKNDGGLKKTTQVDGFEFCMQYRPYEYIALMENKGDLYNYDLEKRLSELKGTAWFSITIKRLDNYTTPLRYGIYSNEEYNTRLNYFLNEARKDIWLVYGDVTLNPVTYLFENNFNLVAKETMIVGFYLPPGEKSPAKKMQLAYNDRIFKNGIIKATYSESTLNNIPSLIY